jgi:hypothetical protein
MKVNSRAVHEQRSGGRIFQAGEHLHECALPRAIFADESMNLAAPELQINSIESADASESLGKVFD